MCESVRNDSGHQRETGALCVCCLYGAAKALCFLCLCSFAPWFITPCTALTVTVNLCGGDHDDSSRCARGKGVGSLLTKEGCRMPGSRS